MSTSLETLCISLRTINLLGSKVQVFCVFHRCSYPVGFLDTATLTSWSVVGKQVLNKAVQVSWEIDMVGKVFHESVTLYKA